MKQNIKKTYKTDLPVFLPIVSQMAKRANYERQMGTFSIRLKARHGVWLAVLVIMTTFTAHAQTSPELDGIFTVLWRWKAFLFEGFMFNILISFMAMTLGTIAGILLGLMQISLMPTIKFGSWFVTQFFRNAPWLTLLFFCMFMLPFEFNLGFVTIPFPDWMKAVLGLSLPIMANISEVVRGSINSIPNGQWEAAESLAFTRRQQIWQIILPQCAKRMIPPWMNWYSILTMATVVTSIVGVEEVMTGVSQVSAAEGGRTDLLLPLYSMTLLLFFIYCYPIARFTIRLERKFAVK